MSRNEERRVKLGVPLSAVAWRVAGVAEFELDRWRGVLKREVSQPQRNAELRSACMGS